MDFGAFEVYYLIFKKFGVKNLEFAKNPVRHSSLSRYENMSTNIVWQRELGWTKNLKLQGHNQLLGFERGGTIA